VELSVSVYGIGGKDMVIPREIDLVWAIRKVLLIVICGLSTVLYLAWAGAKKIFRE
jgi:hypothetical protein